MDEVDKMTEPDSEGFIQHLEDATNENLNDIDRCGCITIHYDESLKHSVIVFIPKLALYALRSEAEDVITRKMLLYFIRKTTELVQTDYSILYCHTAVNILSQQSLILEYYKIMPRRYKKNLKKMFILHPQFGIKMFFEFTRLFVSAKFYNKLVYVENITMLQKIFLPYGDKKYMELAANFVFWEDTLLKKYIEYRNDESNYIYNNDLKHIYISALQAPYLLYRCCEYIRYLTKTTEKGGMRHEGLFRIAGDHVLISLVRIRLQLYNEKYSISKLHVSANPLMGNIEIVNSGHESKAAAEAMSTAMADTESDAHAVNEMYDNQYIIVGQAAVGWKQHGYSHTQIMEKTSRDPASIVISNIDSVAQILKLVIADLPNPLIVYSVYDELISISKTYLHPSALIIPTVNAASTVSSLTSTETEEASTSEYEERKNVWRTKIQSLFQQHMPIEHSNTLNYVIKFLAEVSTYAEVSKMTVDNLAIVFAPIILRSSTSSTDQMAVLSELNTCKLIIKMLIIDELNSVQGRSETKTTVDSVDGGNTANGAGSATTGTDSVGVADNIASVMNEINNITNTDATTTTGGASASSSPHSSSSSTGRVRLNLNTREKRATKNVTASQTDEL